jgi:nucleoside-diphosphate-sugar epimerase
LIEGRQIKSINFAPREGSKSVLEVTQIAKSVWGEIQIEEINIDERSAQNQALESIELHLNSKLAEELLGWKPEFSQEEAVKSSINWWKSLQTSKTPASELISADVKAFLQRKVL